MLIFQRKLYRRHIFRNSIDYPVEYRRQDTRGINRAPLPGNLLGNQLFYFVFCHLVFVLEVSRKPEA